MRELQLSQGDTVLVKAQNQRDTVLTAVAGSNANNNSAQINQVVCYNLQVKHGDAIIVCLCPNIKHVRYIALYRRRY